MCSKTALLCDLLSGTLICGIANTADPLGGSYFVERLTLDMEKGCWEYFERLDAMGGMVAAQAASQVASQVAQQQAMNQLAGFNGQIKSKDDVTVQYQLVAAGQTTPLVQNSLQGKAKSNGEDVLTPLLTQAATEVLTKVSQK